MMTAILIILLLGLLGACATMIRHAIPMVIAAFSAWPIWLVTRDGAATTAVALVSAGVVARLLQMAGSSHSVSLRRTTIAIELVAVGTASAAIAFALFLESQSPTALAITVICAGILGVGLVLRDHAPNG